MSAYGSYLLETFVTLLAVCAIAFVVLYGAKRFGMGKTSGAIHLVGQLPLDARRCIYLVKVGGQVLVVGVGEGGFTKLAEMPESDFAPELIAERPTPPGFSEVLARAIGRSTPQSKPPSKDDSKEGKP